MKVFISGPMSGKPNFNREAFFKAQEELEKLGYSVWNPAWLAYPSDTEFSKDAIHAIDNEALRHCDAIYMLKGWKYSEGARNEHDIAFTKGLTIMYEGALSYSFKFNLSKESEDRDDIKNIKGDIERQEGRLNCHNNRLMSLTDKINDVNQAINEVKLDLRSFGDRCNNRYASNVNKINKLEKDVKSIKESLRLDSYNNCRLDNHADRIGTLEDEVEDIKKSIDIDNLKEQLDKDFDDVYTEFQSTKDKVNDIEFGYIDWSSKMSSAIDEMEKVKDTVKGLNSLVVTLGERNGVLSDKLDDYKEAYMHLDNADEALERRIKALEIKAKDFDNWFDGLSGAIDNCGKDISDIHRILNSSDIENSSIKAMNDRMNLFSRELDSLSTAIDMRGKDIGSIVQQRCDDNRNINNMINVLNVRLKAIEKRLNIKPFYAPTEDEKDDD